MMRIYTCFSLPGLIIHELMHILFGLLSGYIFSLDKSWTIWHKDGSFAAGLEPINKKMNLLQLILVPMAPLYFIITIAILGFFNPIFLIILIYFIVTYFYSFPSSGDYQQLKYAKVYLKYKFNDAVFIRFMEAKSRGVEFLDNIKFESPEN